MLDDRIETPLFMSKICLISITSDSSDIVECGNG